MYELIIFSVLMSGAVHGYVIAGVINDVIGPFARASNGRIYPLLAKLEADGMITVKEESTSEGGRTSRTFAITGPGRERFRELMLDTSSSPREYRELFAFKVTAFEHLAPGERLTLLHHYIDFARAHVRHLQDQGRDLAQNGESYGHSEKQAGRLSTVFAHLMDAWQDEARWAEELLSAETAPALKPKRARAPARKL